MKSADAFPSFTTPLAPGNLPVMRCPVPRAQASHRILIMRAGAHGDILMGTPLIAALRRAWPSAHITWIVEGKEREAIDSNPFVDEVLLWNSSYWKTMLRRGLGPLWLARALRFQKQLRARQYDIFISLQPEEWPLLTRAVRAAISIGVFDTFRQFHSNRPTSSRTRFYSHAFTQTDLPPHRTDQYLLPLRALGLPVSVQKDMSMGYVEQDRDTVTRVLREQGIGISQPYVVLAPMTTWPSRCWPVERFAGLGDALEQQGLRVILIGSPREKDAVRGVAESMARAPVEAAGIFGFREMAALIASSALLISGDTGPMHVAAAVGTPFVALFGPTPSDGRAPLSGCGVVLRHNLPCSPCDQKICPLTGDAYMRCMTLITVDDVLRAAETLLPALPVVNA